MNEIRIGKRYDVYFEMMSTERDVELLYMPVAVGDTWRFKTKDGNEIAMCYFAKLAPAVNIEF